MKPNNGIIIAFEGLDCSFKETNYNAFKTKMKEKYGEEKIFTESFPRYENESTANVKKWLQGEFDRNHLMKYPLGINSLYSIDRLSYWFEKNNSGNYMINNLRGCPDNFFCFDRYNFSNSLYNPKNAKYGQKLPCIDDFNFDLYTFGIPNPNIVIWMRMKNFDVLADLLAKKENNSSCVGHNEYILLLLELTSNISPSKSSLLPVNSKTSLLTRLGINTSSAPLAFISLRIIFLIFSITLRPSGK